jgi:hypothetical protein
VDCSCRREDRGHRARKPWENGYCESFDSKLRDELLNGEIFYSLAEAKVIIEAWRRYDNTERATLARMQPVRAGGHRLAFKATRIASPATQTMAEKPSTH